VLAKADPDPLLATADVAFGQPDPGMIADAPHLKWIHISSSGITRYDNPQFRRLMADRKIQVSNSAAVYCEACAVHVLSFMLAQARRLPAGLKSAAAGGTAEWLELRAGSSTLQGETVLILGYGTIGKRLTQLLQPFGLDVIAYRRHARGDETVPVVTEARLAATLGRADHVVNILPDSSQTRGFFSADRLAQFKLGAVFYNIGRGTTVDQEALVQALRNGPLKAAWLDVTEPEPLPDSHPLRHLPNCFITPHTAGGRADEFAALVGHFLRNLQRFTRGEALADRVM
jgi:phosphoglycerate dehydrogenase-like enzyme